MPPVGDIWKANLTVNSRLGNSATTVSESASEKQLLYLLLVQILIPYNSRKDTPVATIDQLLVPMCPNFAAGVRYYGPVVP